MNIAWISFLDRCAKHARMVGRRLTGRRLAHLGARGAAVLMVLACSADLGVPRPPLTSLEAPAPERPASEPNSHDLEAPVVDIDAVEETGEAQLLIRGRARDDQAVVAVSVRLGNSGPYHATDLGGGFATWQLEVADLPGPVSIYARAYDRSGQVGEALYELLRPAPLDVAAPVVRITSHPAHLETHLCDLALAGSAHDDTGIAQIEIASDRSGLLGYAKTADHFQHWSLRIRLSAGSELLTVRALDVAGNLTTAQMRLECRARSGGTPPVITLLAPQSGQRLAMARPVLALRVSAAEDVAGVSVRLNEGAWRRAEQIEAELWSLPLRLRVGENRARVVARDANGLVASELFCFALADGWGEGPRVRLRAPKRPGGDVVFDLDQRGIAELFPEQIRASTVMMRLDPRTLMTNALREIRDSCGPGWETPDFEPDCPLHWGQREWNVWRLLTMTPLTAQMTGTSLEMMAEFTDWASEQGVLALSFGEILSLSLQLAQDEPVVGDHALVEAMAQYLLPSHPAVPADGRLPITMQDALCELATLPERFGPAGGHPGFLAGRTSGQVMTPEFRMKLLAASQVRMFEGLDLEAMRKEYLVDPGAETPLIELDFLSQGRFAVTGIQAPSMTFGFPIVESDAIPVLGALDPQPRGGSNVWDLPPWTLERLVAEASFIAFSGVRSGCDRCAGATDGALLFLAPTEDNPFDLAEIVVGRQGYDCLDEEHCTNRLAPTPVGIPEHFALLEEPPAGWMQIWNLLEVPAPATYVWDLIVQVVEARLRDGEVPPGDGDVVFELQGIDTGVTVAQMEAELRAQLHAQRDDLAEKLLGNYAAHNKPLDVLVDTDDEETLWLLAAACPLPLPEGSCRAREQTGFYADVALEQPIHLEGPRGLRGFALDETALGRVIYTPRADGRVCRLEIEAVTPESVDVWLRGGCR